MDKQNFNYPNDSNVTTRHLAFDVDVNQKKHFDDIQGTCNQKYSFA